MSAATSPVFGELLKRYRIAAGMTQEGLAAASGLSPRGISDLERGARKAPRQDTVAQLGAALQLTADERAVLEAVARRARSKATFPQDGTLSSEASGPPFLVGRTAELFVLEQCLAGVSAPVLVLTGEPGIGKSHLLREAARRAATAGYVVLAGGCHRHSAHDPFSPLLEALMRHLRDYRMPAQLRAALQGCAWLARLLPELAETAVLSSPRWELPAEQERRLMFAAVARFLANVASPSGTVLILDDLHWASADSLALLASILRSPDAARLRVVLAYRTTEVRHDNPLALMLSDLAREGRATRVTVGPLDTEAASELLDCLLAGAANSGSDVRDRLLQRAGGVPLFLVSYAHAARSGAFSPTSYGSAEAIPWDVAETIRQQMSLLPEVARELLGVACVLGSTVERSLLVTVALRLGRGKSEILAGLDAACQARLLVETGEDEYAFTHDLVRDLIGVDLGLARRRALHQHVAETIEEFEGARRVELLAYHYAFGEDQEKALVYLEQAGDRARALYASADAADYYRELVHRLDSLGRTAQAARGREKLAAVLMMRSRYVEALETLEQAVAFYTAAGETERLAEASAQIGWAYALCGIPEAGVARLRSLLDSSAARDLPSVCIAALYDSLAELYVVSGRYAEQLDAAEHAAQFAQRAADTHLLSQAEMCRGIAYLMLGRLDEAASVLVDALPAIEVGGDLRDRAHTLNNIALIYQAHGDFGQYAHYGELALSAAQRLGDPALVAYMLCNVAEHRCLIGQLQEARVCYEQAVALIEPVSMAWAALDPAVGLAVLSVTQSAGEAADSAAASLEALSTQAQDHGAREAYCAAELVLAERALLQGRAVEARDRLAALTEDDGTGSGDDLAMHAPLRSALVAWALVEGDDLEQATELLHAAIERAAEQRHHLALVDLLRMRALAAVRARGLDDASTLLDEVIELCRAMPYPYAEAKALYVYGQLHEARDELVQARETYRAALVICDQLGEGLYRPHIERALAALVD
jgi:tetratricopeptide (TPR) repeat protein/transcriptional regulator with XRE-family HTH domain